MPRPLRSNLPVGSTLWAARRAQWRVLGIAPEDLHKPKIAIINSSSGLASCFSHLDAIAIRAKAVIRAAGALAFEVRTAAPSDFITSVGKRGGYILPTRDLITNDIEVQVEGAQLDGMLCLASCDKTTPGQLMAAGRLDIPTIVGICGYQASGKYRGEHVDIEEVFLKAGHVASGRITVDELAAMADVAVQGPGVCAGMGTANSMHIVCEALGMTLPGAAPVQADSLRMHDAVDAAARRIVAMVETDLRPRAILTRASIANAVKVVLALSGSINCVKHLQAIAVEADVDVDVYALFQEAAACVPLLATVRPNGDHLIEDFDRAGGALSILKQLAPLLDLDTPTVSGQTLGDHLSAHVVADDSVIRPLDRPFSRRPAIVILRGSLLPGGGIVRLGGAGERTMRFSGPANLFHSREEALAAIDRGAVRAGDVVILRGIGVRGGPGMALTSAVVFALEGAGLIDAVAVITEGQVSGLVNRGLVIAEASPEAMAGGPIGLLENGDIIAIDVPSGRVDHALDAATLDARRARAPEFGTRGDRGYLGQYQRTVGPVHEGATLRSR